MIPSLFVSDLHGKQSRYKTLFDAIAAEEPAAVFLGGDLLPSFALPASNPVMSPEGFVLGFLLPQLSDLRQRLGARYPRVFIIPGNDDPRAEEEDLLEGEQRGVWEYAHNRVLTFGEYRVAGYACVPPTPFLLKDWERYDVSRYVDPGSIPPTEGRHTVAFSPRELEHSTIQSDLERLSEGLLFNRTVFLFHAPPYRTALDRAALDGVTVDHAPLDPHVGSIAIKRFIEKHQPLVTLHGHVHESARLTGAWRENIGTTVALSAAHDGPELALVRFDLEHPESATRELRGNGGGASAPGR